MVSISNISEVATEQNNTTGVMTPILEVSPRDGTQLIIQSFVNRGEEAGVPIYADLEDGAGDDLPTNTEMAIQFERPADENPQTVSVSKDNIRPYNALSISEQQNTDFVDRVKHELRGAALVLDDVDTMYVVIDSSAQIDWSNSRLQFDESAVEER